MQTFLMPVLALIIWSLVMMVALYIRRIPAIKKHRIRVDDLALKGAPEALRLPPQARAVADNYNHLMEQPTLFYALMFYLAVTGLHDGTFLILAWGYVGLRVIHSLIQSTGKNVLRRFIVFAFSSALLVVMALMALAASV